MMNIVLSGDDAVTIRRKIEAGFKKRRNSAVMTLARMLVKSTPVDTGEARGGWEVGESESLAPSGVLDPDGEATLARISAKLNGIHHFSNVVLSNPVEHFQFLERGSSSQAPLGVVRVNLAAFKAMRGDVE